MKRILIFIIPLTYTNCELLESKKEIPKKNEIKLRNMSESLFLEVYEYEGCEYIVEGYNTDRWGSHKGNCKNPIHKVK